VEGRVVRGGVVVFEGRREVLGTNGHTIILFLSRSTGERAHTHTPYTPRVHTRARAMDSAAAYGLADDGAAPAAVGGGGAAPGIGDSAAPASAPLREDMVENAVGFLVHPKVR
jgi:hypothetical protein